MQQKARACAHALAEHKRLHPTQGIWGRPPTCGQNSQQERSPLSLFHSLCLSLPLSPCLCLSLPLSPSLCLSLPLSPSLSLSLPLSPSLSLSSSISLPPSLPRLSFLSRQSRARSLDLALALAPYVRVDSGFHKCFGSRVMT